MTPALARQLILLCSLCTLMPGISMAEEALRLIAVEGQASIELEPDQAILDIDIREQDASLDKARQKLNNSLKQVIDGLIKQGHSENNIEKTQVWQGPDYSWENNRQVLQGYSARIQLKLTIKKLESLSRTLDTLAANSSTTVSNTRFIRSDEAQQQQEVRKQALLNARSKAESMLAVYKEKAGRVHSIRESGSVQPVLYSMMAEKRGASDAGGIFNKVTISSSVQVEFSIE